MRHIAAKDLENEIKTAQGHDQVAYLREVGNHPGDLVYHAGLNGYANDRWGLKAKGVGIHDPHGADNPFLDKTSVTAANGRFGYASPPGDLGERRPSILLQSLKYKSIQLVHNTPGRPKYDLTHASGLRVHFQ